MSSTSPLILADGITKRFGANQVLTRVSLDVLERDVVCVVGPSGSGKTTLLRCLALLEEPSEGRVVMEGVPISTPSPNKQVKAAAREVRSEIGMVFQHFNLFPHKCVLDNVTLAPMLTKDVAKAAAEKRAMELLDMVGLADKARNMPAQLSGGQKQRVAIARALALSPKIMLFDEVTSALDPELVEEVLNVMHKLASETDMTMLLVTHEMGFAHDFADRILFFDRGKIVEEGKPDEIFRNPRQERTQTFLRKIIAAGHRV